MSKHQFKAINLIAKTFEENNVRFRVVNILNIREELIAGFSVDCGPKLTIKFICKDNESNDVGARVYGLINRVPDEKVLRVMQACNILNREISHMKFCIDTDHDVNIEYDFPSKCSDDCVGEIALETFIRTMKILDSRYELFMKAIYTDEKLEDDISESLQKVLDSFRSNPEFSDRFQGAIDSLHEKMAAAASMAIGAGEYEEDDDSDDDSDEYDASDDISDEEPDEEISDDEKHESFASFLKTVLKDVDEETDDADNEPANADSE